MFADFLWPLATKLAQTVWGFLPSALAFAAIFTVLSLLSSQACNPGRPWWRNPGLATDIGYMVVMPFIAPYMRISLMIGGAALLSGVMTHQQIADYIEQGRGPLAGMPFWAQVPVYVVVSDFLLLLESSHLPRRDVLALSRASSFG